MSNMDKTERYNIDFGFYEESSVFQNREDAITEFPDGEWVLAEDYDRLARRMLLLKAKLAAVQALNSVLKQVTGIDSLLAEAKKQGAIEAQLQASRKQEPIGYIQSSELRRLRKSGFCHAELTRLNRGRQTALYTSAPPAPIDYAKAQAAAFGLGVDYNKFCAALRDVLAAAPKGE